MLPTINGKSLLDCGLEELQVLIDNSDYRENEYLDYKGVFTIDKCLRNDKPREIAELRSDVCAFANAEGGYLIFGVKEDGKGIVHELLGIDIAENSKDKFELNLKTYLQAISPRSPTFKINFVELESGKYIVIIFVQHDFFAPYIHLVDEKDYRIYKRVGNSKAVITYAELKNMFTQSMSIEKEIERFRRERITYYREQEDSFRKEHSIFLLLHIIPDTFMDSSYDKPMFALERKGLRFSSIFNSFWCNTYSFPMVEGIRYKETRFNAECRLYNSGIAEVFFPLLAYLGRDASEFKSGFFDQQAIWENISGTITEYKNRLTTVLTTRKLFVCITIVGCKGIATENSELKERIAFIDRELLLCNPVVFEDIGNEDLASIDCKRLRLEYLLSLGIKRNEEERELLKEIYGE